MKKFLSLLLAVMMVVSVVPLFVFSTAAASSASGEEAENAFPELVITEIYANSINYRDNAPTWLREWPESVGFYAAPQPSEYYYAAMQKYRAGQVVPSYAYKKVVAADGTVSFEPAGGETANGTTEYYKSVSAGGYYDSYQYIEVYNSGSEPLNLYDYKLALDHSSSFMEAGIHTSPVTFNAIKPGPVTSSFHNGFERVKLEVGSSAAGYYTKDESSFIPCGAGELVESDTEYYRAMASGGEYFVTNPNEAILQPGECAVLWFYTNIDNYCGAKLSYFREYYEWQSKGKENQLNMDNVMVIAIDANSDSTSGGYCNSVGFQIQLNGQKRYGIVTADYNDPLDNNYLSRWVSSATWEAYAAYNESRVATRASVKVGETVVTSGYFIKDEVSGFYYQPRKGTSETIANGTASADENGRALEGVSYYTLNLSNNNVSPTSHRLDRTSANYVYGFDSNAVITNGVPYTVSNYGLTPGSLTEVQRATLPNGKQETSVPKLVITEVMPDSTGADEYEYVEVVNTSGTAINIFDYSFVARTSSYMTDTCNEFFNKVNPLIPGDVGNILAAEPGAMYYDTVPTNITYEEGWLAPGEIAILWSYYSETAWAGRTFSDFYDFYGMDTSVKVIAMDSDNSLLSGRVDRQNLGNSGSYIYGLVANENLEFYGDKYTSNVIMQPVHYDSGFTAPTYRGISISDCESFVLASSIFATCTPYTGLGENYGYQYIWSRNAGLNNKCGSMYAYARCTAISGDARFAFSGSVVTEEWLASPGKLLPRQKTEVTLNRGSSAYMLYMQDFEGLGEVSDFDAISSLLGITAIDASKSLSLNEDHASNLALTEAAGKNLLEIRDGKLYVNNAGVAMEYLTLMSDDILSSYRKTNYTIEYSMTYSGEGSKDGCNGYSGVLFGFDATKISYGAPVIRISGYGSNSVYLSGEQYSVEDAPGTAHAAPSLTASSGTGTLYERITGTPATDSLQGTESLADIQLTVRIEVSFTNGVTVYVNDIEVSETKLAASSEVFANWAFFAEENKGTDIVLATSPGISVAYDYIMVYSDTLGTNADDMDIPSLYITELCSDGGTMLFTPGSTGTTWLGWIEYIELTNGGDTPVSLMDYTLVRSNLTYADNTTTSYAHRGNNNKWDPWNGQVARLSDWLGVGDEPAYISYNGAASSNKVKNPSENEAVLQPGESIIILTLNNGDQNDHYARKDANGNTVDTISAARSWLKLSDSQKVMCIASSKAYRTVGNTTNQLATAGFCMWNSDSFIYGVGRNTATYYDGTTYEIEPADWKDIYTHDYRKLESVVDHNMSISIGQNNTSVDFSDVGLGGTNIDGCAAHFLYGNDNSMHYKYGTVMNRRNARVMTTYKSGTSNVDAYGEYNVGRLFAVQQSAFLELRKLKEKGYQQDASLVITEYVPNTDNDRGGDWDTFESLEITNIGSTPVNLYDYAVVEGSVIYGETESWGVQDLLNPGAVVGKYHPWYDQLRNISNPAECVVQPGESVVVWVYYAQTYQLGALEPTRDYISVEDFRKYWEDHGNPVINQKDENGEYKVKVLVTVAGDSYTPSFNLANSNTATFGICVKYKISAQNYVRGYDVISYATNAISSMAWDLGIKRVALTPSAYAYTSGSLKPANWSDNEAEIVDFGKVLFVGDSAEGLYAMAEDGRTLLPCAAADTVTKGTSYYYEDGNGGYTKAYVNEDLSVKNYCLKTASGYQFATGTHAGRSYVKKAVAAGSSVAGMYVLADADTYTACAADAVAVEGTDYYAFEAPTYYQLYYYANVQTVNDVGNLGYNFVYGTAASGSWSVGSVIQTTKVTSRTRHNTYANFGYTPDFTPLIEATIESRGGRPASLGYLIEEQLGMVAAINFTEGPTLADGTKVYLYKTVTSLSDVAVEMLGASVTATASGTAAAFSAAISAEVYRSLQDRYGSENISFGMLTARVATLLNSGANLRELVLAGAYVPVTGLSGVSTLTGLYYKDLEPVYTRCTSGALAEVGVTYYSYDATTGSYTEVADVEYGSSVAELYTKRVEDVYTSSKPLVAAAEGVEYYTKDGETYTLVADVTVGETNVYDYYTKSIQFRYVPCAAGSVVEEGVEYFIPEGSVFVPDYSLVGEGAFGLYVKEYYDQYDSCAVAAPAEVGVDYYRSTDEDYQLVTGIVAGTTDVADYFTKSARDVYTLCGSGIAQSSVTYYELTDAGYDVATVATPEDVSAYYTKSMRQIYAACAAGSLASAADQKTYYRKNADDTYSVVYGIRYASTVSDLFTRSENEVYTAATAAVAEEGVTYYALEGTTYTPVADVEVGVTDVSAYYTRSVEPVYTAATDTVAVKGTVYYAYDGTDYTVAQGLLAVDRAAGYYKLVDGEYVLCGENEIVYAGVDYFEKAAYQLDEDMTGVEQDGKLVFTGTAVTMPNGYYTDTFACIAYVKINVGSTELYIYADAAINRSVKQVLLSAILDVSDVQTEEYCFEVGDGTYSRYTAAQRARFEKICAEQ